MRRLIVIPAALLALSACVSDHDLQWDNPDNDTPLNDDDPIVTDGPQPDIKVEPEALGFGYMLPGCPGSTETVTVSNVGEADLEIFDIVPTGPGIGSYTYNGPSDGVLAVGESLTFQVSFSPAAFNTYEGFIEISSNDPDEAVTGTDLVGHGSENPRSEDIFIQPTPDGVDVLWVVDNSGSMSSVVSELGTQFDNFINTFVTLGLDYQIAVVTTDMDDPNDQGKFEGVGVMSAALSGGDAAVVADFKAATDQGSSGSGDERGSDAAYAALTAPLVSGVNAGLVRPGANLSVIVVSDEEDSSNISQSDFVSWLNGYKGDPDLTSFSGIVGDDGGFALMCPGSFGVSAMPAPRYHNLINGTSGMWADLCNVESTAFPDMLTYLSYTAAGLSAAFPLSDTPSSIPSIIVTVDGVTVPFNPMTGWSYDFTTNTIEFNGSAIPGPNATIVITYEIDATC